MYMYRSTGVVLALILLVAGCASDPSSPEQGASLGLYPFPWLKVSTPTYGDFHATAQTRGSSGTHYNSGGLLYTSTNHTQEADGGVMTASDMQIPIDGNGQYLSIGQPTFGAVTSWGLSGGSGIPAFTDSMYIPEEIVLTAPVASTISRTTGVTVGWNADAANDSVVVGFRYDVITIVADSTLPYTDYSWYRIVPDNGQYTIPASAFSAIPVGGYVEVVVARGNAKLIGPSTHKFHVYGATAAYGIFNVTL